ncbi:MAG: ribulose-bisphosphate carboxylase large subunit [Candidatus Nanohaloarchaeota archaeon]|nr:ribulose-bisphosphate carboxylase large subunit [Candidatus Nanohaloarchaeota archaeon]
MYGGYKYIEESYEPKKDEFKLLVWVKGKKRFEELAEGVAAESSVGTWTKISTMNKKVFKDYRARIYRIKKVSESSGFVWISYPYEHFDERNLLQFYASVFGNVYGLKELEELYMIDLYIPLRYQRLYDGPKFGLEGIRRIVGTHKTRRPHVGTIVKPKVGLTPAEFAKVAYDAWVNGLDLVKDDENLVNQKFCGWKERFDKTNQARDKAETKTGEVKLYATNITDMDRHKMYERIDYVAESGNKLVMMDVFIMGFALVKEMVEYAHKKGLAVHAHRAGYAALHRSGFGYDFRILSKFYRLLGVDQLHIGTGVGKMEGNPYYIKKLHDVMVKEELEEEKFLGFFKQEWDEDIKAVFPVASGGLDAGKVEGIVAVHGKDVVIQAGGGVHGHPKGSKAGAKSMRQAVEAVARNIALDVAAKQAKELKQALEYFGYIRKEEVERKIKEIKESSSLLEEMVYDKGLNFLVALRD